MAFTEADRVQIRKYLGVAAIYLQAEPLLENAISAVQATADGGSRPDNTTELEIRAILTKLAAIDAQLDSIECLGNLHVGNIRMDPIRAQIFVRSNGRIQVGRLAAMLATRPVRDCYSPSQPANFDMPQLEGGRRTA